MLHVSGLALFADSLQVDLLYDFYYVGNATDIQYLNSLSSIIRLNAAYLIREEDDT